MTVTRVNGMIVISDIINGYLVSRKYIGYTIKEAKQMFRQEEYSDRN